VTFRMRAIGSLRGMLFATVAIAAPVSLSAQWINHATAGVPRNPDGSPNLQAPAPRMANGKPDLSGVWEADKNRPCPKEGCADQQLTNEFVNLGLDIPGGLPYQPWALALMKERKTKFGAQDPTARCLPLGLVKMLTAPFFRKIVQSPTLMILLSERDTTFRQIFTDGRTLPEDPEPSWNGFSAGHWEGGTLVVESVGFRDGTWLDRDGNPLTESAKITERYNRVNYGRLETELTVNDPKAYTKPWTVKLIHNISLNNDLLEYYCTDNDKNAARFLEK